jgi:aminopeptidase N
VGRSGIEYPNLVFEGLRGIDRVTTHELGHQWFFSLVGNDQAASPWLDEALATYAAGRRDGFLPFFRSLRFTGVTANHVGAPMAFWDAHPDQYTEGVYFNGVKALLTLGPPSKIDCALRAYVAEHAFGIATPEDLLDALTVQFPNAREVLRPFGIS